MKNLQRTGGFAALYLATAYLTGIVVFLFVLDYPGITDSSEKVDLIVDKEPLFSITNLLMYVVFGVVLVVLVLALYERLKTASLLIISSATVIGVVWAGLVIASGMVANEGVAAVVDLYEDDPARAEAAWVAIEPVANALGGANGEMLGGLMTLLVSWAALQVAGLPKFLNYLGLMVGVVGIASAMPGLGVLAGLFGMSQILWFVGLGIVLLDLCPRRHTLPGQVQHAR